jgi:hypothetical protein
VHFTPTSGSWLNLVEVWFGIIQKQAIRGGTFASVRDLNAKIRSFVDGWNDRCHPFVWTKTADENLKKANRHQTSETLHCTGGELSAATGSRSWAVPCPGGQSTTWVGFGASCGLALDLSQRR